MMGRPMFSENFWNGFFKVANVVSSALKRSPADTRKLIQAHIEAIPAAGKQVFEAPAHAAATALKEKPVKTLLSRKIKDAANKDSWINMNRR